MKVRKIVLAFILWCGIVLILGLFALCAWVGQFIPQWVKGVIGVVLILVLFFVVAYGFVTIFIGDVDDKDPMF